MNIRYDTPLENFYNLYNQFTEFNEIQFRNIDGVVSCIKAILPNSHEFRIYKNNLNNTAYQTGSVKTLLNI